MIKHTQLFFGFVHCFRRLQPWSCFSLQLFWFSSWKPTLSGTSSPGRPPEVSCWPSDIRCSELSHDCVFSCWLYALVSRIPWYVQGIQGHEEGQLEELGQILSRQGKLRRCQKRTRRPLGREGDQVSARMFARPSRATAPPSCSCTPLCYSDAREMVQSNSGRGAADSAADQAANRWGRNGGDPNVYRPRGLPKKY